MQYVPVLIALIALSTVAVRLASADGATERFAVLGLRRLVLVDNAYAAAIIGLGAALVVSIFTLRLLDSTPPSGQPARHFLDGLYLLHEPRSSSLFQSRPLYPFLSSVVAVPFNVIGSYDYTFTTACVGSLFLVGTVLVTFVLGRELFGREAGVLAALFTAVYPTMFGLAHAYTLDLPLTFMVALTMLLLLKSREFSVRRMSVLTGVAVGVGAYTSYPFALWVLLPLVAVAAVRLVREARERRMRLQAPWLSNAGFTAAIALAIALPWYAPRLGFLFGDYLASVRGSAAPPPSHPPVLSFESLAYYPRALWHVATLPMAIAFLVFALAFFTRSRSPKLILAAWIVGGYLTTTLWPNKETTYLVPMLPAVALVTAAGMLETARASGRWRITMRGVAGGLVAVTAIQLYGAAVGISWLPRGKLVAQLVRPHEPLVWFSQNRSDLPRIVRHAWDPSTLTRKMHSLDAHGKPSVKVLAGPAAVTALSVPLEKGRLLHSGLPRLIRGPGSLRAPTHFVIVEAAAGSSTAAARTRVARVTPGLRYRAVFTERSLRPLGTGRLVLFKAQPGIVATPSRARAREVLRLQWSSVPIPTPLDWIGLYRSGAADSGELQWMYTNTCTHVAGTGASSDGWCPLRAPEATGTYEARLFASDSHKLIGRSRKITVVGVTARLSASPPVVSASGPVTVSWSDVVHASTLDWIGLYRRGDANTAYVDWLYDNSCEKTTGESSSSAGSCSFVMPDTSGTYEFRLLASDGSVLATSEPVSVAGGATLEVKPSKVAAGGTVNVSWRNVAGATARDWIGLYHRGEANTKFVDWLYDDSCRQTSGTASLSSGSCSFTMPSASGAYELRLFSNDGYARIGGTARVVVG